MITLTIKEIIDLAEYAGLSVADKQSWTGELETEITIKEATTGQVPIEAGESYACRYYAYFSECPEEGCYPLG